ncbi:MAG: hypothetical protein IT362_08775 [Deltaproteobacteria bacterium]|nr:hypothetical protein [Deltaproteobacteria bacterium]
MSKIRTVQPDIVILAANWLAYHEKEITEGVLSETLKTLKDAGVRRVVVFGQAPVWKLTQPSVYLMVWRRLDKTTERTKLYFDSNSVRIDNLVNKTVTSLNATFISPIKSLCNEQGCLLVAGQNIPVTGDRDHLTVEGSKLLIESSKSKIFDYSL